MFILPIKALGTRDHKTEETFLSTMDRGIQFSN